MAVQAALGSDIALAFDECTPYHADRDYTGALDRAHPPLARSLPRLARATRARRPGGVRDRPGRRPRGPAPRVGRAVSAAARRRDRDRRHARPRQARDARRARDDRARMLPADAPKHLLGIGEPDDLLDGIALGHRPLRLRGADPPRPPRDGAGAAARGAVSLRRQPGRVRARRGGRSSRAARARPALPTRRAYLHYLSRAEELTAARLLTLHNLAFLERLVAGAREAIRARALRRATGEAHPRQERHGRRGSSAPAGPDQRRLLRVLVDEVLDRPGSGLSIVVLDHLPEVGVLAGVGEQQDAPRRSPRRAARSAAGCRSRGRRGSRPSAAGAAPAAPGAAAAVRGAAPAGSPAPARPASPGRARDAGSPRSSRRAQHVRSAARRRAVARLAAGEPGLERPRELARRRVAHRGVALERAQDGASRASRGRRGRRRSAAAGARSRAGSRARRGSSPPRAGAPVSSW